SHCDAPPNLSTTTIDHHREPRTISPNSPLQRQGTSVPGVDRKQGSVTGGAHSEITASTSSRQGQTGGMHYGSPRRPSQLVRVNGERSLIAVDTHKLGRSSR